MCRVPPNCTFEIDDFENEWLYNRPFDYIHGRELMGFIADHDHLFARAFQHLKPGGWFEVQTTDPWFYSDNGTHEKATNCKIFLTNLHEAGEKFGKSMGLVQTWREKMIKAGFVDVHCEVRKGCFFPLLPIIHPLSTAHTVQSTSQSLPH